MRLQKFLVLISILLANSSTQASDLNCQITEEPANSLSAQIYLRRLPLASVNNGAITFQEVDAKIPAKASAGAVFVKETAYPKRGEAWRDPGGIVWGEAVKDASGGFLLRLRQLPAAGIARSHWRVLGKPVRGLGSPSDFFAEGGAVSQVTAAGITESARCVLAQLKSNYS